MLIYEESLDYLCSEMTVSFNLKKDTQQEEMFSDMSRIGMLLCSRKCGFFSTFLFFRPLYPTRLLTCHSSDPFKLTYAPQHMLVF